jgi:hypothetical protein
MSPAVIVDEAVKRGIDLLALTDHNSALNCPAFAWHCRKRGVLPLFGMEAATREELHTLCLFSDLEAALEFSRWAYGIIMPFPNNPAVSGDQVYVDEEDNILGEVENWLVSPLDTGLEDLSEKVLSCGGILIPAHVDRPYDSMTSQLGVVVEGPWSAIECMRLPPAVDTLGYPLTTSSDAHYPGDIGRRAFDLDSSPEVLAPDGQTVDLDALKAALARRPKR